MNKPKQLNQQGIVSIITVIFLAAILALITTGFVKTMISNQRQSLDLQLSTQAFYAAESAVNDTVYALSNGVSVTNNAGDCTSTITSVSPGITDPNVLNTDSNIKYTCLVVNNSVPTIEIGSANSSAGNIYPIAYTDPDQVIDQLTISWGDASNLAATRTDSNLPTKNAWGSNPAVLRATIFYPGSTFSRNNLINSQKTFFLIPNKTGVGNVSFNAGITADGSKITIQCNGGAGSVDECKATINNISPGVVGGLKSYYIRVVPIYSQANISISGTIDGVSAVFVGAQYSIDATGRANDVYKRYEYRKSIRQNTYNFPDSVLKTNNSICKQFAVWPGDQQDESASGCSF